MVQTQSSLSFSLQIVKSLSKTSISSQNLGHPPLFSKCFIYISKLGTFSLICQFFSQHDPHKITHLQTRGILPSLSILLQYDLHRIIHLQTKGILPSLSTKQSSLNIIHTISHVFENKGIHPHFSIG